MRCFGQIGDRSVEAADLVGPDGSRATILAYGAVLQNLEVPLADGRLRRVVLGFAQLEDYVSDRNFIGRIVGRHANRIRGGRFELDGKEYRLTLNERGRTHLHGGSQGFWSRIWRFAHVAPDRATLELVSPDGDEGYPGEVTLLCTYSLTAPATLRLDLTATTTAATIVNIACHSYFVLEPGGTTRDLRLRVAASRYTPVDDDLIPTGGTARVDDTPYDFREARRLRDIGIPLDMNYVLDKTRGTFGHAATVHSAATSLEVWTTEPGLQVYDGHLLPDEPAGGLYPTAAMCLEAQLFPDGPNHAEFPSSRLAPGDVYRQTTEYRFQNR